MLEISTLIKVEHDGEKILFTEEAFEEYKKGKLIINISEALFKITKTNCITIHKIAV